MFRMILTDLDDTLLRSDKTISARTADVLRRCREAGFLIGFSTARAEHNSIPFIEQIRPDAVISSAGALVRLHGEIVHSVMFTEAETLTLLGEGLRRGCEITVDALSGHYWNYTTDPVIGDPTWGHPIHTDYSSFSGPALKLCMNLPDEAEAAQIASCVPACDWMRFSGGSWYKFTRTGATKEGAILALCAHLGISPDEIIAFGDDVTDAGMLQLCGRGVAMANAVPAVKEIADDTAPDRNEDGVAEYLARTLLAQR